MKAFKLERYYNKGKQLAIPKKDQEEIERLFNESIGDSDIAIRTITTLFPNLSGENKTGLLFEVDDVTMKQVLIPVEQVKMAIERLLFSHSGTQAKINRDIGNENDETGFDAQVRKRVADLLDFVV